MNIKNVNLTIRNKLLIGFGLVLILFIAISVNNFVSLGNVSEIEDRLLKLRVPTVVAGLQLADGVHLSLSGLRGYMILGKAPAAAEKFKAERQQGWQLIDGSLAKMEQFSQNWTDPKNIEMLQEMKAYVEQFRVAQQEVEDIAHSPENVPSFKLLLEEAAPRAAKVIEAITALIDEESKLEATEDRKALLKLLADSRGSFALSLANIRAYLLSGDEKFADKFHGKWKVNELRFNEISKMTYLFSPKQKQAWNTYVSYRKEFSPLPAQMFELRSAPDWNRANYFLGTKAAPKAGAIMQILNQMRASQDKLAQMDEENLHSEASYMKVTMVVGTLIVIVVCVLISMMMSRMISIPLKKVVDRAKAIAAGDLTGGEIKVAHRDELGELTQSINEMNNKLLEMVNEILSSSEQIAGASEELSMITEQSSRSNNEQQAQTEQVATAMNEMSATVQEIASNISTTAAAAEEANTNTVTGNNVVESTVHEIQLLGEQVEGAAEVIYKLEKKSNDISSVLDVIKSVAEQTNLLALNAAIEAARAGEQGRGFAVVADEVRSLASKTQDSTAEINQVIEELQSESKTAVDVMNKSIAKTKIVIDKASKAGESLSSISSSVGRINSMSTQIASAAEQQSATSEEINRNITRISEMGNQGATTLNETVVASESLAQLGSDLQSLMAQFKT